MESLVSEINLLNGAINLLVGVTGVFVGWYLTKYKDSVKYAIELHKEFNNAEMSKYRRDGWKLVKLNLFTPINEIHDKFGDENMGVLAVMRFYQRLWVAVSEREIQRKLAIKLFADIFFYWYIIYYQDYAKSDWTAMEDIHKLAKWYKKVMTKEQYYRILERHIKNKIELIQTIQQ